VALGLADLPWASVTDCEEVGTLKPQPEVFLEAGRRMGLAPPEILVVGDRRDADVTGAHAAGMYSAWLKHRDPGHGGGDSPDLVISGLADLLVALPQRPRRASHRHRARRRDLQ
jgi:putative hydrolase of the HAD superfamily